MTNRYWAAVAILVAFASPAFGGVEDANLAVWVFKFLGQAFAAGMVLGALVAALYVAGMPIMLAYYTARGQRGTRAYRSLVETYFFCLKVVALPVALGAGSGMLFYLISPSHPPP